MVMMGKGVQEEEGSEALTGGARLCTTRVVGLQSDVLAINTQA